MLRFSLLHSHASPVPLPEDHDQKLRHAFGRFAMEGYLVEGVKIIATHYSNQGVFHCDCCPDAKRAPRLFVVKGNRLRREDTIGSDATPHDDNCDFAYEPDEQKQLVETWRPFRKDEYQLKLAPNFDEKEKLPSASASYISTRSCAPYLARVLFNILHEAKTDRILPTSRLRRHNQTETNPVLKATLNFSIAPDKSLLDWTAMSVQDSYELKRRLEAARSPEWPRPCGLFIDILGKIGNKTVYLSRSDEPIKVMGDMAIFGKQSHARERFYVVIGVVTFPTKEAEEIELYDVYAHPCFSPTDPMLIDSAMEDATLALLIDCRDWLAGQGITVTVEKPMFDLGATKMKEPREVCRPDFILYCRRGGGERMIVIIETIGFDDAVYRERKRQLRSLHEQIKGGQPPHPVIVYDRFRQGMSPQAVDDQFRINVCTMIIRKCPREE
jgi:hypothetical protein